MIGAFLASNPLDIPIECAHRTVRYSDKHLQTAYKGVGRYQSRGDVMIRGTTSSMHDSTPVTSWKIAWDECVLGNGSATAS